MTDVDVGDFQKLMVAIFTNAPLKSWWWQRTSLHLMTWSLVRHKSLLSQLTGVNHHHHENSLVIILIAIIITISIVFIHCGEEGCIGLYISRAEGNLEVGGDVQPNSSRFEALYGQSLIINPSLDMYQEIRPCRANSIDSVKINTSLPMMRECNIYCVWHTHVT